MVKSMTSYVSVLSSADYEVLEDIFDNKFCEFRDFYWLICEYSDYTTSLVYDKSVSDRLRIEISLANINIDYVINEIEKSIENDNISFERNGNTIMIEIKKYNEV